MKFKISSWDERIGTVFFPSVKMYSLWPFFSYDRIDNKGASKTREDALKRIDDYCRYVKEKKSFKSYSEYIIK